jgi:hypothetical protein
MEVDKGALEELFADRKPDRIFPLPIAPHATRSEQELNNKFNSPVSQPGGIVPPAGGAERSSDLEEGRLSRRSGRFEKDG